MLRVGFIGTGVIFDLHILGYLNSADAEVAALCNRTIDKAKEYNRKKIIFSLIELGILLCFLLVLVFSGLSFNIKDIAVSMNDNPYLQFLFYVLIVGIIELILFIPLNFYTEFILEHKYQLSNQTFAGWLWESFKSLTVSIILFIPLLILLYYFLLPAMTPLSLPSLSQGMQPREVFSLLAPRDLSGKTLPL